MSDTKSSDFTCQSESSLAFLNVEQDLEYFICVISTQSHKCTHFKALDGSGATAVQPRGALNAGPRSAAAPRSSQEDFINISSILLLHNSELSLSWQVSMASCPTRRDVEGDDRSRQ